MASSSRIITAVISGIYVALSLAAGIAYGPLAAVAVIVVLSGPTFIGIVCFLPEVDENDPQRRMPHAPQLHAAPTH